MKLKFRYVHTEAYYLIFKINVLSFYPDGP